MYTLRVASVSFGHLLRLSFFQVKKKVWLIIQTIDSTPKPGEKKQVSKLIFLFFDGAH